MTVNSDLSRKDYAGDGVTTTPFTFPYYFFAAGDLKVTKVVVATGIETPLVLNTDYTVTGAGEEAGGFISLSVALPVGTNMTIIREVAAVQTLDYIPNDTFPAESHEQGLDRLTMICQQILEKIGRSLILPVTSTLVNLLIPTPSAGKFWRWNATADALENADVTGLGAIGVPVTTLNGGSGGSYATVALLFAAIKQAATTALTGVVEKATQTETNQGTADKYPSAAEIVAAPYLGRRNKARNSDFQLWQRGTAFAPSSSVLTNLADGWQALVNGTVGTLSIQRIEPPQAERQAVANLLGSAPSYQLGWVHSVAGSGQTAKYLQNRNENLAQYQGRTIRVSFVAYSPTTPHNCSAVLLYNYGTGGAPSATEASGAQAFTITTVIQRFSFSFDVPDFSGKTFGTDGPHTSDLTVRLNLPLNAAGTLRVCSLQVEFGEVATSYDRWSFGEVLRDCLRYFWKTFAYATTPAQNAGNADSLLWRSAAGASAATDSPNVTLPVPMRVPATFTLFNPEATNAQVRNDTDNADCSASSVVACGVWGFRVNTTTSAGTAANEELRVHATADAEFT